MFLLLVMVLIFGCTIAGKTRPLKITVVDAKTGKPLENIEVFYSLVERKMRARCINLMPLGGADLKYFSTTDTKKTDKNGVVMFSNLDQCNVKYDVHETICINLYRESMKLLSEGREDGSNINKKYFGVYVGNYYSCVDKEKFIKYDKKPSIGMDIQLNCVSLSKSEDNMIIKLRRFEDHSMGIKYLITCEE